jgi:regulator of RNase E activity RraA
MLTVIIDLSQYGKKQEDSAMHFNVREAVIAITPQWQGERFPDGRPRVADKYLQLLYGMTLEEVWKPIFVKGYESQFEGRLQVLHRGKKLVGRAVTCNFCPSRPDLHETLFAIGMQEGRKGNYNQWVIDTLVEGDVVVADMYDKIYKGTFVGGNLTTAISTRTKTGGAVIWGGVRDVEQMETIDNVQVYYRGIDPTPIRDFVMTGFNTVTQIGGAVCLPGDIVFGAGGGVLFIPSHLVAEVVDGAAKSHIKDIFGFEMITQNVFTTAQIDRLIWTLDMLDMLTYFIKTDPRGEDYRDLDWSAEYDQARSDAADKFQSAL